MILHYVLFQIKKTVFVAVIVTTTPLASVTANGRPHPLVSHWLGDTICPASPLFHLSQISATQQLQHVLRRWEKKPHSSASVATFKHLPCRHVKTLTVICSDLTSCPSLCYVLEKFNGPCVTTWPCFTYNDEMWGYMGRLAGVGWMQKNTFDAKTQI